MNRSISNDVVQEYAGSELTDAEATELVALCDEYGIVDEDGIHECEQDVWLNMIGEAVERAESSRDDWRCDGCQQWYSASDAYAEKDGSTAYYCPKCAEKRGMDITNIGA